MLRQGFLWTLENIEIVSFVSHFDRVQAVLKVLEKCFNSFISTPDLPQYITSQICKVSFKLVAFSFCVKKSWHSFL